MCCGLQVVCCEDVFTRPRNPPYHRLIGSYYGEAWPNYDCFCYDSDCEESIFCSRPLLVEDIIYRLKEVRAALILVVSYSKTVGICIYFFFEIRHLTYLFDHKAQKPFDV